MAKCNWDGVNGTDKPRPGAVSICPQGGGRYTREFLIRAWFRYDANVDNVAGNKLMRMAGDYPKLSFYAARTDGRCRKRALYIFRSH